MAYYVDFDISTIDKETKKNDKETFAQMCSRRRTAFTKKIMTSKDIGMKKILTAVNDNLEPGYYWRDARPAVSSIINGDVDSRMTMRELSELLNVKYDRIAGWLTGRRAIGTYQVAPLCKLFLKKSCHEIMFGDAQPVKLPQIPAMIGKTISALPLNNSASFIQELCSKYNVFTRDSQGPGLVKKRLFDLADDRNVPIKRLHLTNYDLHATSGIWVYVDSRRDQVRRVAEWDVEPSINRVMELSLMLGVPLDYLICDDYTEICEVGYESDSGIIIERRPQFLKLLSIFIRLPDEKREEMFRDVMTEDASQRLRNRSLRSVS